MLFRHGPTALPGKVLRITEVEFLETTIKKYLAVKLYHETFYILKQL